MEAAEGELIRNRCLCFGDSAGDEREWRWRCGCRCLNLYPSVSLHSRGTAMSLLLVSAVISVVPVTHQKQQRRKTGMVPIKMEQANICLSAKS